MLGGFAMDTIVMPVIEMPETPELLKKIDKGIDRNGLLNGIDKPEPLKHRKACSRRITEEHRLVYNMDSNQNLIIYSCKYHYED